MFGKVPQVRSRYVSAGRQLNRDPLRGADEYSREGLMSELNDAAAVRVFPPGVPLVAILIGVGLESRWPIDLNLALASSERYWIGGAIILGAVLVLGLWSVVVFRRGGQDENPWKPTPHIEQRGPFRVTRNPMYLQMLLVCIGFSILLANWWILVLTPVTAWLLQRLVILPEEEYLERKFDDSYLSYKRRVRRWL